MHAVRFDQYAHAAGCFETRRKTLLLRFVRMRLQRRQAEDFRGSIPKRRRRLSSAGGRRLRLGETFFGTHVQAFREDFKLYTRVARFHNVYGPWGTWFGGREKAPAAICRKVIEA